MPRPSSHPTRANATPSTCVCSTPRANNLLLLGKEESGDYVNLRFDRNVAYTLPKIPLSSKLRWGTIFHKARDSRLIIHIQHPDDYISRGFPPQRESFLGNQLCSEPRFGCSRLEDVARFLTFTTNQVAIDITYHYALLHMQLPDTTRLASVLLNLHSDSKPNKRIVRRLRYNGVDIDYAVAQNPRASANPGNPMLFDRSWKENSASGIETFKEQAASAASGANSPGVVSSNRQQCPNPSCPKPNVVDGTCRTCGRVADDSNNRGRGHVRRELVRRRRRTG